MKKLWTEQAWKDYLRMQERERDMLRKVNQLIRDTERSPFTGKGKPEPLKGTLSGYWSRRITDEHRLVYRVEGDILEIYSCRSHYDWDF